MGGEGSGGLVFCIWTLTFFMQVGSLPPPTSFVILLSPKVNVTARCTRMYFKHTVQSPSHPVPQVCNLGPVDCAICAFTPIDDINITF